ncbi:DUF551 domain-containing protein [Klebsiella pneumoniae]|uniref:DUF551 domain-containing protein n=1 Tax=Klebsiella pneumoniae TaxID=573 RepID=UPI0020CC016F|nr:DUF551 domain-containing protein [Klebsiella pneumoniae]MCQ0808922.1 DUF551 domain-containing protein [Klebsiella pneumoniae]
MTNNQLTKEWLQQTIAELESVRDEIPFGIDTNSELELAAFKMALAAMDSEPVAYTDEEELNFVNDMACMWTKGMGINEVPLYRHAQPAPVVVPEGLNPETTDLVLRFASALADKLYKAEQKYGRSTDWMKDDWYDDCLQSLWEHIEKGDPRDVAAYCAFMWYHGWVTTDYDRNVQNACRAAMLHAGNSPAQSDCCPAQNSVTPAQNQGWIPVSERMPEKGQAVLVYRPKAHEGGDSDVRVAVYGRHNFEHGFGCYWEPSHWMPLPAAPQEVK